MQRTEVAKRISTVDIQIKSDREDAVNASCNVSERNEKKKCKCLNNNFSE